MKVSSITVGFDRKVQPAQYESAGAQVSLTLAFDADEEADIDAAIADAMDTAKSHVLVALGRKAAGLPAGSPVFAANPPAPVDREVTKTSEPVAAAKEEPAAAQEQKPAKPAKKADAAPAKEPTKPALEVTDGELIKAIGVVIDRLQKAGATDGSSRVKKLIEQYVPDGKVPFTPQRIAKDKRAIFLADLEAMEA